MGVEYYLCLDNGKEMVVIPIGRHYDSAAMYDDYELVKRCVEEIDEIFEDDDFFDVGDVSVSDLTLSQMSKLYRLAELIKKIKYESGFSTCGNLDKVLKVYGIIRAMEDAWLTENFGWRIVADLNLSEVIESAKKSGREIIRLGD